MDTQPEEILRLFKKLKEMEDSGRFSGQSYPPGIERFPKTLTGQGFFPGGDGLWRDDEPAKMRLPSPYQFPRNGIMFLGNDFGALSSFSRLKIHENPPTWRYLRTRLSNAKIAGQLGFYTNAYLGLRTDRSALAEPISDTQYDVFCKEFLELQIFIQRPRLIVVLGNRPTRLLHQAVQFPSTSIGEVVQAEAEGLVTSVVTVSPPYSDLGKSDSEKQREGTILASAWASASR